MAKRSLARYKENDELADLAHSMKGARKLAGINQSEFGKLIGISRETVVHIEGLYESTLLSLECEVLKRWYSACASKICEKEREKLQTAITRYLFSSVRSAGDKKGSEIAENITSKLQKEKVTS